MSTFTRATRVSFTSLAFLLAIATPACRGNAGAQPDDGDAMPPSSDPTHAPGDTADGGGNGPKATPVTDTPPPSDLTDALGVFVSASGRDADDGTNAHPVGTLTAAIALAQKSAKRVYACAGTYKESLVLADSISIIGGLDCSDLMQWKPGTALTRIEAPSSPAIRATNITSKTRLEALDVVAPDATDPSGSSIGLLADHSPGLFLAKSKLTASNGAAGAPGSDAVQLFGPNTAGAPTRAPFKCGSVGSLGISGCIFGLGGSHAPPGAAGAQGVCAGAPGHDGGNGGNGGSGGLWDISGGEFVAWVPLSTWPVTSGVLVGGAPGSDGQQGPDPSPIGSLAADGYAAAPGGVGANGSPGFGGTGAPGLEAILPNPSTTPRTDVWTGAGGAGGGAGGCPGLAAGAAGGGGASIALASIESAVTLQDSMLKSGSGGAGGRGNFGSDATAGSDAGANLTGLPQGAPQAGGRGGLAGVGTNGGSGPSLGIFHAGPAPTVLGSTLITHGKGAPAIDARSHTDALGNTRTIPATPVGVAADIKTL